MSFLKQLSAVSRKKFKNKEELWVHTFKLFSNSDELRKDEKLLEKGIKYLIRYLLKYGSTNFYTVAKIIKIHQRWLTFRQNRILEAEIEGILMPLRMREKERDLKGQLCKTNDLISTILRSDTDFMCVLVKYGVYLKPKEVIGGLPEIIHMVQDVVWFMNTVLERKENFRSSISLFKDICEDQRFRNGMLRYKDRSFRRLILTVMIVKGVQLHLDEIPHKHNYIRCIELLFECISEPFISTDEFREFLQLVFCYFSCSHETTNGIVESMTEMFTTLLQNHHTFWYSPRSLKHLCRCKIREVHTNESSLFPCFVENMNIPTTLKHFLLGASEFSS